MFVPGGSKNGGKRPFRVVLLYCRRLNPQGHKPSDSKAAVLYMHRNDEILRDFLRWLNSGHTKATVQSYSDGLRNLRHWLYAEQKAIIGLTLNDITRYSEYLQNRGVRSSTHFHYMTAFKCLWKWLYKQALVSLDPDLILMPCVTKERRGALMPDEFEAIMKSYDERYPVELRNKLIVCFLYATGLRLGEFLDILLSDIKLGEKCVEVRTYKRKNHRRTVYWDERTQKLLLQWLPLRDDLVAEGGLGHQALFVSMDNNSLGKPIQRCVVQRIFRNVRLKLGMKKKISPHSCRHGFATRGVKANINLSYLKDMLGHANINNTMVYVHQEQKHLQEEYRKIYGY